MLIKRKLSLLVLIIVLASIVGSSVYANSPSDSLQIDYSDSKVIKNYLTDIAPYVSLNVNKIASIDSNAAKRAGVSSEAIAVATKYFNAQNDIVSRTMKGESILEIEVPQELQNYFLSLANEAKKPKNLKRNLALVQNF